MTVEELQSICSNLKGVTLDIKWEDHLCFSIGGKMFLVTSPDNYPVTASFKVSENDFEIMCGREGFMPAPYLARYKWVHVDDISRLNLSEWERYAQQSYQLIYEKLPAKEKALISGLSP